MKVCPEWRDALTGCAAGDDVEPALAEALARHVADCPACADGFVELRKAAARMDKMLRWRTAVVPPVYGPERVMARIGERHPAPQHWWWRWAMAGCAMALLIAGALWTRRPAPPPNVAALVLWHSPTDALLRPPVSAAWDTTPRLGELFFEVRPSGEMHAQ